MSFRDRIKHNVPKVDLASIVTLIVGDVKSGKTRLWKEVTELHYPNDPKAALLIAWEKGFETWDLANIFDMTEESSDEAERWEIFKKEIVPELVAEAKVGRKVKLIGTDTVDKLIVAAEQWILRNLSKKYGKKFESIGSISGSTDDNGYLILGNELSKPFEQLRNAGYGLMHMAWTKEKETTLYDERKYNAIELAMHNTARKVFHTQASLICCLHSDITIMDKQGNVLEENLKNKSGKDIGTKFHETQVYMYFRPSQYISIAGGRYIDLPEKVEYSAENFLQVFEDAVKGQLRNPEQMVEIKAAQEQEREEKTQKFVDQEEKKAGTKTPEELIAAIAEAIDQVTDKALRKEAASLIMKILGVKLATDYKTCTDPEKLQQCLEAIKSL